MSTPALGGASPLNMLGTQKSGKETELGTEELLPYRGPKVCQRQSRPEVWIKAGMQSPEDDGKMMASTSHTWGNIQDSCFERFHRLWLLFVPAIWQLNCLAKLKGPESLLT